jgi:hypothetical protein
MIYQDAEIYMTRCIHPDYSFLRYIGLDTKKDKNYLGSSTTLKWFIKLLGKSSFEKEILDIRTGTMSSCCFLEQTYIKKYNAIDDPHFLNMNGARGISGDDDTSPISMDYILYCTSVHGREFVEELSDLVTAELQEITHQKNNLIRDIFNMVMYGYLMYDQLDFRYCAFSHYGTRCPEDVESILDAMVSLEMIDVISGKIQVKSLIIDEIPITVSSSTFKITMRD